MGEEIDLLLKTLLFPTDDDDRLAIPNSLHTDPARIDDSVPHPADALFARAAMAVALAKGLDPGWNEEVSTLQKRKRGTLAERLGVTRTEIKLEDGVRTVYAYNDKNEVVDLRMLAGS